MKRPRITDNEYRRKGMNDVPIIKFSKTQDKYIDHQQEEIEALRNLCLKFMHPRYYLNLPAKFRLV
jgi:hypothetical protein